MSQRHRSEDVVICVWWAWGKAAFADILQQDIANIPELVENRDEQVPLPRIETILYTSRFSLMELVDSVHQKIVQEIVQGNNVRIIGRSAGGFVAALALSQDYHKNNKQETERLSLMKHDRIKHVTLQCAPFQAKDLQFVLDIQPRIAKPWYKAIKNKALLALLASKPSRSVLRKSGLIHMSLLETLTAKARFARDIMDVWSDSPDSVVQTMHEVLSDNSRKLSLHRALYDEVVLPWAWGFLVEKSGGTWANLNQIKAGHNFAKRDCEEGEDPYNEINDLTLTAALWEEAISIIESWLQKN